MTKKEKVLDTTLRLIAAQGIQGTPMSQISRESGVATGTIYHHFKSKEAILNEIYLQKKVDFERIIEASLNPSKRVKTQFADVWTGLFQYYTNDPLIFTFTQQVSSTPIITPESRKAGELYFRKIYAFFKHGIQAGHFLDMDVHLLTRMVHGNIHTLAELSINGSLEVSEDVLNEAIAFSWRAIVPA
ncbi:MAG: TetR/AcrR family transcriptional regulator [Bacteroidota bacterium]